MFKNLLCKLLNPNQNTRIKIEEVEIHAWIFGLYVEEMPNIDTNWKQEKFQKYANVLNTTTMQIEETISDSPFGQLAGIFNIEQHSYKLCKMGFNKPSSRVTISDIKNIKVMQHYVQLSNC